MSLSALPRHQKFEVGRFSMNDHFSRMGDGPSDPRSLNFLFILGWARMVSAQLSIFSWWLAGHTNEVNSAEGHLSFSTHILKTDRGEMIAPSPSAIKKAFEALWFLGGVWTLIFERCAYLNQALGCLVWEVVILHHRVESPGMRLSRHRDDVRTRKSKKSRLSLGSHCREKGSLGARKVAERMQEGEKAMEMLKA